MGEGYGRVSEGVHEAQGYSGDPRSHAVFHSVLNRTGATRYLVDQVLPTLDAHQLVLWWQDGPLAEDTDTDPSRQTVYLRKADAKGRFARSRLFIFALQVLYMWRHRTELVAVTINSISNLGAIIGCLVLRRDTEITVYVHERPIGKWRLSIAVLRRVSRAQVVTVSPFIKSELEAAGVRARWAYPAAFATDLRKTLPDPSDPDAMAGQPDIVVVGHPDGSKGFAFLTSLLQVLDPSLSVALYLSRPPATRVTFPDNVIVRVGQVLTPDHYRARLTVLTSDPIGVKETFSYITAESLAAGTPVLCFPSGGVSEQLIHGVNGYFVAEYSVIEFKSAIEGLFAAPATLALLQKGVVTTNALKGETLL